MNSSRRQFLKTSLTASAAAALAPQVKAAAAANAGTGNREFYELRAYRLKRRVYEPVPLDDVPPLPVAVPPARHETSTSYLARLASLHGLDRRELFRMACGDLQDADEALARHERHAQDRPFPYVGGFGGVVIEERGKLGRGPAVPFRQLSPYRSKP